MEIKVNKKQMADGRLVLQIDLMVEMEKLSDNDGLSLQLNLEPETAEEDAEEQVPYTDDFKQFASEYEGSDHRMTKACARHFCHFVKEGLYNINNVLDTHVCHDFWIYLCRHLNGGTPANYFKKFRLYLQNLVQRGRLDKDPSATIKLHYPEFMTKDPLSSEEVSMLWHSKCQNSEVQRAFVFACSTGLRWCDIEKLRYEDINLDERSMNVVQQKVSGHSSHARLCTFLNNRAMDIVSTGFTTGRVFHLPSYSTVLRVLRKWTHGLGMAKKITFHCARHSFVSNLVAMGVDLKTVADLAGHSSTRHTERYAHSQKEHLRAALMLLD